MTFLEEGAWIWPSGGRNGLRKGAHLITPILLYHDVCGLQEHSDILVHYPNASKYESGLHLAAPPCFWERPFFLFRCVTLESVFARHIDLAPYSLVALVARPQTGDITIFNLLGGQRDTEK